jgi:hypothetical protein
VVSNVEDFCRGATQAGIENKIKTGIGPCYEPSRIKIVDPNKSKAWLVFAAKGRSRESALTHYGVEAQFFCPVCCGTSLLPPYPPMCCQHLDIQILDRTGVHVLQ